MHAVKGANGECCVSLPARCNWSTRMVRLRRCIDKARAVCSQDVNLRALLLKTEDLTLVEAAPNDAIWGIGQSVEAAARGAAWNGLNLLGNALMRVREVIRTGGAVDSDQVAASRTIADLADAPPVTAA